LLILASKSQQKTKGKKKLIILASQNTKSLEPFLADAAILGPVLLT
jgi:hypothetical protein